MEKKILKIFFVASVILMIIICASSCNENSVDPYANLEPGRRDYIWKTDTIKHVPLMLERLWGSSPDDVWAIGNNDAGFNVWHFDGKKWSRKGNMYASTIWGFSSDDIWAAGADGKIWHYNGNSWKVNFRLQDVAGEKQYMFYDIWGDSPENIFAVGYEKDSVRTGLMLHNTGGVWKKIDHNRVRGSFIRIRRGIKTNNKYYLGNSIGDAYNEDTTQIFEFDGLEKLTKIYESKSWKSAIPQEINGEVFFNFESGLYRYNGNPSEFQIVVQNNFPEALDVVVGRNIKDVVWKMWDGLSHYNGENIEYVLQLQNDIITSHVILFDKEILLLVYEWETNSNLIYRGKLE